MPAKRALLIGIADYPHVPPLDGCVNDVRLMRTVLVERFGFPPDQIALLENEQATRAGILAAFDALVAAAGTDDIVVFHFAGHGSQIADREGDEPSGFDSTLVPYDAQRPIVDVADITDDEIKLRLEALAQKTAFITVVIDACHSGTVTRADAGERVRSIERDLRPASELPASPIPAERRGPPRTTGPSGWMPLTDRYVLIAGCRDEEESYEYRPAEGQGKVVHGSLTWFLCQELRQASATASHRDVFERTAALVNAANRVQHPQLEGRIDRELFGVGDFTPAKFVRILEREGDAVLLGAGAAHGLTVGSTWNICPHGAKDPATDASIGEVEILQLQSVTAVGRITSEATSDRIAPEARAFERVHVFTDPRLTVALPADVPDELSATVRQRLEALQLIEIATGDASPAVRIHRLPEPAAPAWSAVSATGDLLMPLLALDDADVLVSNLERIATHRRALAIENLDPASHLRGQFTLVLQRLDRERKAWTEMAPDAGAGRIVLHEADIIRIVVRSRHDAPVFVWIYDFGMAGAIDQIYPARGAQEQLRARGELVCRPQQLAFPAVYPFVEPSDPAQPVEGIETVKLLVTEQPTDFSALEQAGVRAGSSSLPLAGLAPRAFGGRATGVTTRSEDDWTTVSTSFVLRRRSAASLSMAAGQGSRL